MTYGDANSLAPLEIEDAPCATAGGSYQHVHYLLEGERWNFQVMTRLLDAHGNVAYHCAACCPETGEVREQVVDLDWGRRPGHVLWEERVQRRINDLGDGDITPFALVKS